MVDEGTNVSEFESFTLEDAGGEKAPPKEAPKEEVSQSSEPPDSSSGTARLPRKRKSLHQSRKSQTQKEEDWKQALTESLMQAHLQRRWLWRRGFL
jgi:hypothetical protein